MTMLDEDTDLSFWLDDDGKPPCEMVNSITRERCGLLSSWRCMADCNCGHRRVFMVCDDCRQKIQAMEVRIRPVAYLQCIHCRGGVAMSWLPL